MVSGDQEWRKEGSELSQEVARTSLHLGPQPAQERMPPRERPMWRNTRRCQTLRPRSAEGSKILGKRNSMQRQESDRPSLRRVSRKINLDVGTSILSIEKFFCIIKVFPFHVELFSMFPVSVGHGPQQRFFFWWRLIGSSRNSCIYCVTWTCSYQYLLIKCMTIAYQSESKNS